MAQSREYRKFQKKKSSFKGNACDWYDFEHHVFYTDD